MPKVTMVCKQCGYKARRALLNEAGVRGVHETSAEPASCPKGHGLMAREDGRMNFDYKTWSWRL